MSHATIVYSLIAITYYVLYFFQERTKNAQFIIISLRYNMFEVSNRLVGIYKTEDCTKSVTVDNKIPESNDNNVLKDIDLKMVSNGNALCAWENE